VVAPRWLCDVGRRSPLYGKYFLRKRTYLVFVVVLFLVLDLDFMCVAYFCCH
jgi:hypothetical protein